LIKGGEGGRLRVALCVWWSIKNKNSILKIFLEKEGKND